MVKKTKKKLSRKLAVICSIFAFILSMALGALGFYTYYKNIVEQYRQYISTIVSIASGAIDVEDMKQCVETGIKSEQYEKTQLELDNIKSRSQVEFIYVIKPLNTASVDNAMYVWNAVTQEEREEFETIDSLGDLSGDGFPQDMAEYFMLAMQGKNEVTYLSNRSEFGYVLTGLYPLRLEDGETIGIIGVDIPMDKIYSDLHQYLVYVVIGTLMIAAIFLFCFLRMLNRYVVSPVLRMSDSAADFVEQSNSGLLPSQLVFRDPDVHTEDEIQLLGENLNRMTSELIAYMGNLRQVTAEKERISAELDVATNIQLSMLPCIFPAFPERTEFDIYAKLAVAREMGGSFYDFFLVDQTHLAVIAGEIQGKGVPAALLMMITKTLIKNYAQLGYSPAQVFAETNNQLSDSNEGMTTTAFLGILDLVSGEFDYVNAGHCVPLFKHAGGEFEWLPAKDCFVLGGMERVPYWQQSVKLAQGDLLFLYTKGLVEAENRTRVQYSSEHMRMRLNQVMGEVYALQDIVGIMEEDVKHFQEGAPQEKDIVMVLLRFF